MNIFEWKASTWLVSLGTLIGSIVAIVAGGQALADAIPYASKAYVEIQLAQQSQTRNFDQRDLLSFQILQEQAQVYSLQALPPGPGGASLLDSLIKDIEKKKKEHDLLDCQIRFVVTGITCVSNP